MTPAVNLKKELDHGQALLEGAFFAEAFAHYAQVIEAVESNPDPYEAALLAEAYIQRALALVADPELDAFNDRDVFHQALDDVDMAIDLQPQNGNYLLTRGRLLASASFTAYPDEAEADFLTVLHHHPEHPDALNRLGELYIRAFRYEEAILCFDTLLQARPGEAQARLFRALANYRKDPPDYERAIADFNEAEKHFPDSVEIQMWRAASQEQLGNLDAAISEYDRLIAKNGAQADLLANRGRLRLLQGDTALGRADFEQAVASGPHALALNNLAWLELQAGNAAVARSLAAQAIAVDPGLGVAYATCAEACAALGDSPSMFIHLKSAIVLYYAEVSELLEEPAFVTYHQTPEFQHLILHFEAIQGAAYPAESDS